MRGPMPMDSQLQLRRWHSAYLCLLCLAFGCGTGVEEEESSISVNEVSKVAYEATGEDAAAGDLSAACAEAKEAMQKAPNKLAHQELTEWHSLFCGDTAPPPALTDADRTEAEILNEELSAALDEIGSPTMLHGGTTSFKATELIGIGDNDAQAVRISKHLALIDAHSIRDYAVPNGSWVENSPLCNCEASVVWNGEVRYYDAAGNKTTYSTIIIAFAHPNHPDFDGHDMALLWFGADIPNNRAQIYQSGHWGPFIPAHRIWSFDWNVQQPHNIDQKEWALYNTGSWFFSSLLSELDVVSQSHRAVTGDSSSPAMYIVNENRHRLVRSTVAGIFMAPPPVGFQTGDGYATNVFPKMGWIQTSAYNLFGITLSCGTYSVWYGGHPWAYQVCSEV